VSKKLNTVLFVVAATLFNIVLTAGCFLAMFLAYANFIAPHLPQEVAAWAFLVIFIISVAASFFAYRALLQRFLKRGQAKKAPAGGHPIK